LLTSHNSGKVFLDQTGLFGRNGGKDDLAVGAGKGGIVSFFGKKSYLQNITSLEEVRKTGSPAGGGGGIRLSYKNCS